MEDFGCNVLGDCSEDTHTMWDRFGHVSGSDSEHLEQNCGPGNRTQIS